MSKKDFAKRLFAATKVRDLTDLINELHDEEAIAWRPVGGNENNLAIINLGSDPAAGVVERVTNALDSITELEWVEKGQPPNISSPRMAAEKWFGIKNGRMAHLKAADVRKLDKLSTRVEITLQDSDRDDKPTIDIRDSGIGILSEDFAESILSLNKNRKLRKLFLAGAFGQGGSTALAYSPYTLICSRKAKVGGISKPHPFAFTVVRFNPGDVNVDKHGVYEYMVDVKTGCPMTLPVGEEEFPHGTLVRHLTMEVGKYAAVMTAPTGSLWWLVHNYLFDPVLPFRIQDNRTNKNSASRTVTGNHRLLTQGEHTQYKRDGTFTFRDGQVTITWWVLSTDGENARARLTQYVMTSKPIVVTYNGQKQGDFPNTVIKDELKLPYLDRYLVVHVDCDKLDPDSRRQLFPTTREALRDTPIGDDLRRLVVDTLAGDDELKRLDHERKQRYIKQEDQGAVDAIRRRLAKRVKTITITGSDGQSARTNATDGGNHTHNKREPIPVQDPPTFLKIVGAAPRKVYAGRSFTLKFETDARPDYFLSADNFIAVINPPAFGQYTGTASVRDGYGVAYFKAAEEAEIGKTAKITLELRPPKHTSLSDTTDAIIAELPNDAGGKQGEAQTPNINPRWVQEGDLFWKDNGWNKNSVAQVVREDEGIDIYVSASNERLSQLIARAQRRDIHSVDQVKNFYLEHVSFFALLQDLERTSRTTSSENGGTATGSESDGKAVIEANLNHACETVCGIIEGIFEVLVNAPSEKQ